MRLRAFLCFAYALFVGGLPILIVCSRSFQQECNSYRTAEWVGMAECAVLLWMVASLSGWIGYHCWKARKYES